MPWDGAGRSVYKWRLTAIGSALFFFVLGILASWSYPKLVGVSLPSTYQAVLLTNGAIYIGRTEGLGRRFLVLREVYYFKPSGSAEGGEQPGALVKRGDEWHSPDRMVINAEHVILIEPVGEQSELARMIAKISKKPS